MDHEKLLKASVIVLAVLVITMLVYGFKTVPDTSSAVLFWLLVGCVVCGVVVRWAWKKCQ